MLYGDEKPRHMARSILPCAHRDESRKAKRAVKRGARRVARSRVKALARDPDAFDFEADFDSYPEHEVRSLVHRRRQADKLNHFVRWAEVVTEGLPAESRLSRMRALLPEGLIGEHAVSHLKQRAAFLLPQELELEALRRALWRPLSREMDRGEMAELLRELLTQPELHQAFNDWMHKHHVPSFRRWYERRFDPVLGRDVYEVRSATEPTPPRKLLGAHDVLPFLRDIHPPPLSQLAARQFLPHDNPEWLDAARAFLRAFKVCGPDLTAIWKRLARGS